jgi:hypothetical protein
MDSDSVSFSETFVVDHPAFGNVTFVFDSHDASSGFAASEGFIYLGVRYPKFDFAFRREGRTFAPSPLNNLTRHLIDDHWRTISEITPPAFRSFVLSKAKELAESRAQSRP